MGTRLSTVIGQGMCAVKKGKKSPTQGMSGNGLITELLNRGQFWAVGFWGGLFDPMQHFP